MAQPSPDTWLIQGRKIHVDRRIDLSDQEIEELNQKLTILSEALREGLRPSVSVTFFVPDPLKAGGTYETRTEQIKGIDSARGKLILARTEGYAGSNAEIDLKDILEIQMDTGNTGLSSEEFGGYCQDFCANSLLLMRTCKDHDNHLLS